jgi:hypothetical protein
VLSEIDRCRVTSVNEKRYAVAMLRVA